MWSFNACVKTVNPQRPLAKSQSATVPSPPTYYGDKAEAGMPQSLDLHRIRMMSTARPQHAATKTSSPALRRTTTRRAPRTRQRHPRRHRRPVVPSETSSRSAEFDDPTVRHPLQVCTWLRRWVEEIVRRRRKQYIHPYVPALHCPRDRQAGATKCSSEKVPLFLLQKSIYNLKDDI